MAANLFAIDPVILEGVIAVESNYCRYTKNYKSTAKGCGQQLKGTAAHYGINYEALDDNEASIVATAYLLNRLKHKYPKKYVCAYHVGPNAADREMDKACKEYKEMMVRRLNENGHKLTTERLNKKIRKPKNRE